MECRQRPGLRAPAEDEPDIAAAAQNNCITRELLKSVRFGF